MEEEWREAPGFPKYEVSNLGRARNAKKGRILKVSPGSTGYASVGMVHPNGKSWGVRLHVLIATAFLGPRPSGLQCNHKDGNKMNAALSNLEWVTQSRNQHHAAETGLKRTKLTEALADEIRDRVAKGERPRHIAHEYGVSDATIYQIAKGNRWASESRSGPVVVTGTKTFIPHPWKQKPPRPCAVCGRLRKRLPRGLCHACYMRYWKRGALSSLDQESRVDQ